MKRQFAIFLTVSLIFIAIGLIYGAQVIADLTVFQPTPVDASGTKIVLSPSNTVPTARASQAYLLDAHDARQVVSKRLNQLNLKGYYTVVAHNDQIEVTLPAHENMPYIIDIITRVGQVEFINGGTHPPVGRRVATHLNPAAGEEVYPTLFTGKEITDIVAPNPDEGEIFYQLRLTPTAAERFTRFVEAKNNAYVCLVIDKQVINCSKMYHWSGSKLDIMPNLSSGTGLSLADMAIFLDSGPLPMSLDVVAE